MPQASRVRPVRFWVTERRFGIYERIVTMWKALLADAGVPVLDGVKRNDTRSCHLIFEPHRFQNLAIPARSLLFNTEPLSKYRADSPVYGEAWRTMLSGHHVLDYSQANIEWLREHGVPGKQRFFIGLGSHHTLMDVPRDREKSSDVLFVGAMTPRRRQVLDAVESAGLVVDIVEDGFGLELSEKLATTRLLLNIHAHGSPRPIEAVRLFHPIANGVLVLSERGPVSEVPAYLEDAMIFAPRRELAAEAARLIALPEAERLALADRGRMALSRYDGAAAFLKAIDFVQSLA